MFSVILSRDHLFYQLQSQCHLCMYMYGDQPEQLQHTETYCTTRKPLFVYTKQKSGYGGFTVKV